MNVQNELEFDSDNENFADTKRSDQVGFTFHNDLSQAPSSTSKRRRLKSGFNQNDQLNSTHNFGSDYKICAEQHHVDQYLTKSKLYPFNE